MDEQVKTRQAHNRQHVFLAPAEYHMLRRASDETSISITALAGMLVRKFGLEFAESVGVPRAEVLAQDPAARLHHASTVRRDGYSARASRRPVEVAASAAPLLRQIVLATGLNRTIVMQQLVRKHLVAMVAELQAVSEEEARRLIA